jgi:hypothetical protein
MFGSLCMMSGQMISSRLELMIVIMTIPSLPVLLDVYVSLSTCCTQMKCNCFIVVRTVIGGLLFVSGFQDYNNLLLLSGHCELGDPLVRMCLHPLYRSRE